MQNWKINLTVLWFGQFMVLAGMSMIIPFIPLYIQDLGVTDSSQVAVWAGVLLAANFVTAFLAQPFWGGLADRYGRKLMIIRSGIGMSIVIVLMGFATNVWHLFFLRLLNGTISGFIPAAVALVSASTPKDKMGFALGTLQSGAVAGSILGPFIGGLLADWVGFRPIFYVTGSLLLVATILAAIFVKENFDRASAKAEPKVSMLAGLKKIRAIKSLPSLYAVTFLIQFAMLSTMPLIPLFIELMHGRIERLAFYAGLVGSVTGFANMIAAPLLGKIGDRIGAEKVLLIALIGMGVAFIPQAFVQNIWQLLAVRFVIGLFLGGLLPSVNTLIRKHTPDGMESRAFSFNSSSMALGNMIGPIIGGVFSGWIGIRGIFLMASGLFLLNVVWVKRKVLQPNELKQADSS